MDSLTQKKHVFERIDNLLNEPRQLWLLGAGISKCAGIPLMGPLTRLVRNHLETEGEDFETRFEAIQQHLLEDANVEHVLSHLGDLIALAERSASGEVEHAGIDWTLKDLRDLHSAILSSIREIIRWGAFKNENGEYEPWDHKSTQVDIKYHVNFVNALYERRKGRNAHPPVTFFTTNYDTLLEDALSLCRVATFDGFTGGGVGFWDLRDTSFNGQEQNHHYDGYDARLYKLHGSIDWVRDQDVVLRRRDGATYPDSNANLLIYPQATKYELTQRDPFASLFSAFRAELSNTKENRVLAVCGYSFGDEHINEEIERALRLPRANFSLVAFVKEKDGESIEEHIPNALAQWLQVENDWCDQIFVASNQGVYHGSLENQCPYPEHHGEYSWWKFSGLTQFLKHGIQALRNNG